LLHKPTNHQVLASLQDDGTLADTMRSVEGIASDPAALKQVAASLSPEIRGTVEKIRGD